MARAPPGSATLVAVSAPYDRIGLGYNRIRRPDPRLEALIAEALGGAQLGGQRRRRGRIVPAGLGPGWWRSILRR